MIHQASTPGEEQDAVNVLLTGYLMDPKRMGKSIWTACKTIEQHRIAGIISKCMAVPEWIIVD